MRLLRWWNLKSLSRFFNIRSSSRIAVALFSALSSVIYPIYKLVNMLPNTEHDRYHLARDAGTIQKMTNISSDVVPGMPFLQPMKSD
jgi:hypothetical protein